MDQQSRRWTVRYLEMAGDLGVSRDKARGRLLDLDGGKEVRRGVDAWEKVLTRAERGDNQELAGRQPETPPRKCS
jgi:hypothetical protein